MTDVQEKGSGYNSGSSDDGSQHQVAVFERPTGIKGIYYHPVTQVVMLGFVCFMGPGMLLSGFFSRTLLKKLQGLFNALNGLGGGGQVDATTSANANATLYATFAFAAFFSGYVGWWSCLSNFLILAPSSINNKLGSRLTLLLGTTGYSLYVGAYLSVSSTSLSV